MPRTIKKLFYTRDDCRLMHAAHLTASRELGRSASDENADRLAHRVITLFDRGLRDEESLAHAAAYMERLAAAIVARRAGA